MLKRIVFLGTGGTIAGTAVSAGDNIGYQSAQVGVAQLLAGIPSLALLVTADCLESEQVAQVDSKNMDWAIWQRLSSRVQFHLQRVDVGAVVITHGTDTLEETAFFLSRVLPAALLADKPVVLTCAMRPATATAPDGPQNLLDAICVAREPAGKGVVAVCAGVIHSAMDVQKVHTYRLNAFDSGDAGPLGYVEEGALRLLRNWPFAQEQRTALAIKNIARLSQPAECPHVEIIMSYAGASGAIVQALTAAGVQGLVVAATGNGTLHHALETALQQAQREGVKVVRATRCANGRVIPVSGAMFADSNGLSPVKARIAMVLELLA